MYKHGADHNTVAEQVRQDVLSWMRYLPTPDWETTRGERGLVTKCLNEALQFEAGGLAAANVRRRQVLAFIFSEYLGLNVWELSSRQLRPECWWALVQWADIKKDADGGQWLAKPGFAQAVMACWLETAEDIRHLEAMCGG